MKALTLHQPYASLVAIGAKRIETRSRPTKYRGRILIHAGKREPDPGDYGRWYVDLADVLGCAVRTPGHVHDDVCTGWSSEWGMADEYGAGLYDSLPLGAVVASAVLTDCVPIITQPDGDAPSAGFVYADPDFVQYHPDPDGPPARYSETERSFGDYTPGRWAWLLDDVKPTTARCPRCWGGAIRCTGYHGTDAEPAPCYGRIECGTCGDTQACEPVPMRGRQGLWTVRDHDWKAAA